jgi:hypothetical protein
MLTMPLSLSLAFAALFSDLERLVGAPLLAITQAMCTSFKVELFKAIHNFLAAGGHAFKIALYVSAATMDATTTAYSATNEVSGTGYSAGGVALTNVDPSNPSGVTAIATFSNSPAWTTATFTARGALIYNSTQSNKAVAVYDFGADKSVTAGTFTITMPAADASNAVLRLA